MRSSRAVLLSVGMFSSIFFVEGVPSPLMFKSIILFALICDDARSANIPDRRIAGQNIHKELRAIFGPKRISVSL